MNEMPTKSRESNVDLNLTNQEKIILEYLDKHGEITEEIIQELLNIKRSRTSVIVRTMSHRGLVKVIGRGKNKKIMLERKE